MTQAPDESHPPHGRPRTSPARRIVFAAVTIVILLGVLEAIGRLLVPAQAHNARWAHESNHVRLTGFPALNDILEPDARRFWKLKEGVPARQIIGRVGDDDLIFTLSTDSQGFRGMPFAESSRGTVLFLGDSCTLGIGVDDDATIPAVVQRELPGVQCINAGVPGYSAYQGRVFLESIIADTRPVAVVICFGFNDDAAWDDRSDLEHAAPIAAPSDWRSDWGVTRLIGHWLPSATSPTTASPGSRPRLTDAEFATEIESMIATCTTNKAKPILVVWPLREQSMKEGLTGKQLALLQIGQKTGAAVLNLVVAVRARTSAVALAGKQPVAHMFADLLHFNEEGCLMAAKMIADLLREPK